MTRTTTVARREVTRRTKAQMEAFRAALYDIVQVNHPCSVRQVYYVGIGRLWDKDTGRSRRSYQDVDRNLGVMRENGGLPWDWITDSTRSGVIYTAYDSMQDALNRVQETYRRNLWATQPRRVEVWAESDSTASLIEDTVLEDGVGLYSCRGQAGKGFAHSAAMTYRHVGKPVTILYVGDWDPSGLRIPWSLEDRLNRYTGGEVPIDFHRLAVTPDQITEHRLQTHAVNQNDPNYRWFAEQCALVGLAPQNAVEVEAFPPPVLRQIVADALDGLIDTVQWNITIAVEQNERAVLRRMAEQGWNVCHKRRSPDAPLSEGAEQPPR